jgi:CRISPR type I-E-associated protein CasB/Cse2
MNKSTDAKKEKRKTRTERAAEWWRRLNGLDEEGKRDPKLPRQAAALAALRRASRSSEAAAVPETFLLYRQLGFARQDEIAHRALERAAVLAHVLAHVRASTDTSLGKALGSGDPPVLKEIRLRRLVAARDGEETTRAFREAVALLDGTANVEDLTRCILGWLDPDAARSDRARTRFLFEWHGAGAAAPPGRSVAERQADA